MTLIDTKELKNLSVFELYERLRIYPSYDTAMQDYKNLHHIFMHLGYECSTEEAFYRFVALPPQSTEFQNKPIKCIPINLSVEFVIQKLLNAMQTGTDNFTANKIKEIFGFHIEALKNIFAKFVLLSEIEQQNLSFDKTGYFLTVPAVIKLIREALNSPVQDDLLTHILSQIKRKEKVPINQRTIIMHAIQHDIFAQFCYSFNAIAPGKLKNELSNFRIYNNELNKYIILRDPKLLYKTITRIRAGRVLTKSNVENIVNEILPLIRKGIHSDPITEQRGADMQAVPTTQQRKKLKLTLEDEILAFDREIEENPQLAQQYELEEIPQADVDKALEILATDDKFYESLISEGKLEENPGLVQQKGLNTPQSDLDKALDILVTDEFYESLIASDNRKLEENPGLIQQEDELGIPQDVLDEALEIIETDKFYESYMQTQYNLTFFDSQTNKKRSLEMEEYTADSDEYSVRTNMGS